MPATAAAALQAELLGEYSRLQGLGQFMIRFGVLGTARVVPYGLLAPAKETPGVEVSGIASRTLQKAGEFAARYGIPRSFGSYEALLESAEIDAVYIALPPALHYEWARRAIEAGKHVLCEKPLAENAQLAQELMLLARQHGRVIVEAMHIRHLDRLRSQRELVDGGVTDGVLVEGFGMLDQCQVHTLDTRSGLSRFINDIWHQELVETQDGAKSAQGTSPRRREQASVEQRDPSLHAHTGGRS